MKQFFSENISSMSFTFSFIILLNALLGFFRNIQGEYVNNFILSLAVLILVLFILSYAVSYIDFKSSSTHHAFNLFSQLAAFFVIASLTGLISTTPDSLMTNGIIFVILYYLNYRMRKHRIDQLADAINQHLSKEN